MSVFIRGPWLFMPTEDFDETTYLALNPDVAHAVRAGAFASGREHWDLHGHAEGRVAFLPPDFDELMYLDLNPDVWQAVLQGAWPSGYHHWIHQGKAEGRLLRPVSGLPTGWNEPRYLRLNPDAARMVREGKFASGYEHWLQSGSYEGRPGATELYPKISLQEALKNAPAGFNLFAFDDPSVGLGAAARGYANALRQCLPVHNVPVPWNLKIGPDAKNLRPPYAINLVHMNPEALPAFLRHYGHVLPAHYNVGLWAWELHACYAEWHAFSRLFNEIWVPSTYSAAAVRSVSAVPVHVIPYVVDALPTESSFRRSAFNLDDSAFLFAYVFDPASTFERKNPLALFRAFRKAFGESRDVQLVFKLHHGGWAPAATKLLERLAYGTTNVRTIDQTFSEEEFYGLLRSCDCFVSPHRAEGYGLNIASAMFYQKPVIVTGYSGNMDFTTPDNAFLIDYDLVPLERDIDCFKAGYVWAEPSEDHLAALLRAVVDARDDAHRRAERGQQTIRKHYKARVVSDAIHGRLTAWGFEATVA